MMLAIFDNDGILCDSQEVEGRCYTDAIENITGISLTTLDWTSYPEPTSAAIVRNLLESAPDAREKERAVERAFLRRMEAERSRFPGDFLLLAGAASFLERLRQERICTVAIATGCFATSARYKLSCCGLSLDDFPHATSSDTPRRRDIISLAAARAGFSLDACVYFGDAPWDISASHALNIPMIGIGRRHEQLRSLGVSHVFRDYSDADAIITILRRLQNERTRAGRP
jgi:beta-phosphoglucomutase-like phosphatase (HAD superfamily)